jgi:CheY-like chemotaxis protein
MTAHVTTLQAASMEGRYRLLVDAITDYAIYMLDTEGHVSSWNTRAQRFKGYFVSEILGEHFSRFYTPEDLAAGIPTKALSTAEARLDPGVELLSKPYSREALARKIRHVLNNGKQVRRALEQNAHEPVPEKEPEPVGRAAGKRILLVEDNDLIRMTTSDMLDELGCSVLEAGSAERALTILADEQIDVVVTDLGLPGMSGEDFSREVRRRWPEIGIVFATGMNHGPVLDDPSRTALLPKPHGVEELRQALEEVVTNG